MSSNASGYQSHAEGYGTSAAGENSHAEGRNTYAAGPNSHAEGEETIAIGENQHAGGIFNISTPDALEVIGNGTDNAHRSNARMLKANGDEHLKGDLYVQCAADGTGGKKVAFLNGSGEIDSSLLPSYVDDVLEYDSVSQLPNPGETGKIYYVIETDQSFRWTGTRYFEINDKSAYVMKQDAVVEGSLSMGRKANTTVGVDSTAIGNSVTASGAHSHAEGAGTTASGYNSHAEGAGATASNENSHAEGMSTNASNSQSHAEGSGSTASGVNSHSEGAGTTASGANSHAEGAGTRAIGNMSHAEGGGTLSFGMYAHAEGNSTIASGTSAHAEGSGTVANHACQHTFGEYNVADSSATEETARGTYIEIAGNGTGPSACSNARTLDWDGNEWIAGNMTAAGGSLTIGSGNNAVTITVAQFRALLSLLN